MARAPYNILVIPYRWGDNGPEFALFHRSAPPMCQFVAGGGEDGESPADAARRETFEETGIAAADDRWMALDAKASLPRTAFPHAPWPDSVLVVPEHSFAVDAGGSAIRLSPEHADQAWAPYAEAWDALTWDSNRVALFELNERLNRSRVAGSPGYHDATMETPKPTLTGIAPQFLVDDLDRSIRYYQNRLGFVVDFQYEDFYASVSRDGCAIHLKTAPKSEVDREHRHREEHLDAFITVHGAAALHDEMEGRGAAIVKALEERPWACRDFYVADPDGYLLCFSEPTDGD